jgi:peptidyl-prolyl cis-trans isomerase-like protein 2
VEDENVGEWEESAPEPPSKKRKGGGFGNFDAW